METSLYIVRYPQTESEVIAQETVMAQARADNPLLKVHGISQEAINGMFESTRQWDVDHKQRISIYERSTGELVAGFCLTKESETYKGAYASEVINDPKLSRMFIHYMEIEKDMKSRAEAVFKDHDKVALMHAFGVYPKHRGKGLATLMNEVAIKLSVENGCDYIFAHMVTPETIHISEKTGYQVINVDYIDDEMFRLVHQLEENAEGPLAYPPDLEARIADLAIRFGD